MNNLLVRVTAPFAIWFAHFAFVYGAHAALCSAGQTGGVQSMIVAVVTAIAAFAIFAVYLIPFRPLERAFGRVPVAVACALAMLGVLWTSLPALLLKACA
jgi:hypothetical protein